MPKLMDSAVLSFLDAMLGDIRHAMGIFCGGSPMDGNVGGVSFGPVERSSSLLLFLLVMLRLLFYQ